ncbi:glycosyltransferase [Fibrobacter succinogenes]|uniref:glycosyltransferase n=1 Tax=Fibrobacter succinogenes TaxID=833 RepID=UPI001568C692|nr:glycosyltransferase [Fibrobacter succinogenes]
MKILYICMHNPFGRGDGGDLASHAYFNAFCKLANGAIDLICSNEIELKNNSEDNFTKGKIFFAPERPFFYKLLSVVTGRLNRYTRFAKRIIKKGHYEYVVFDHSSIAGQLVDYAKKNGVKTITIHHNYEYEYYKDNSKWLNRLLFLHHVVRNEKKAYQKSDLNLFLTKQDLVTFENVYKHSLNKNAVLGTFEYMSNTHLPQIRQNENGDCITFSITGTLCSFQTNDGIKYFFSKLFSCMPSKCKVIISGKNPTEDIILLCREHANVKLIKNPENMDDVIQQSDVYLCPTRIGGGLKLRVMDGLRNGIPVLCHEKAARGYDFFYDTPFFKIFHNEMEFKEYLIELIENVQEKNFSRIFIQEKYEEYFSFNSGFQRLKSIFETTFII